MKSCIILDCDRQHHAKGLCLPHYEQVRRGDNPGLGDKMFGVFGRTKCEECSQPPMAGGRWCLTHFQQFKARQDRERPDRDRRRSKVVCGTSNGAAKHRRRGEPLCAKCRTVGTDWLARVAAA